jgi:tripartite-type tricarboxylate transporter receptor subunit TctC
VNHRLFIPLHPWFKSSKVQAFKALGLLILSGLELLNPLNLEETFAQANFYQGKTITLVVSSTAGGGYDLWARLTAQHIVKHIPGNPAIVVQNMPGAGNIIGANYVYGVAKPDGLTLGAVNPALYFDQLVGRSEVKFDWAKFNWIGSPVQSEHLLYMRSDSPYKTIDDIRQIDFIRKTVVLERG